MSNKNLKIYLAAPRGFCAGVDRAIEIVKKSIDKFGAPVYVRHEIVHNKHVVESLKKIGAIFVEELDEIKDKYSVSLLLGSRVKIKSISVGLRYGTLCNAKCMICDHTRSTGWIKDAIKLGRDVEPQYLMDKTKMIDIKHVYQNFDLTDLKYVEFHGGEPLLHSYPEQFLKLFGNQSTVVKINTNGSILPNKDLIKELSKCKRVDILLSIDDIEDRFELLRYPLKWNKIMENLEWYKQQQYRIAVTPTISTLNIWYIEKFFKWLLINVGTDIYPQFVDFPSYLNIKHLNAGVKKILKKQLLKVKNISSIYYKVQIMELMISFAALSTTPFSPNSFFKRV